MAGSGTDFNAAFKSSENLLKHVIKSAQMNLLHFHVWVAGRTCKQCHMDVGSTGVPHLDAASATSPHSADRHRPSLGVSDPEGSVFKLHSKGL